MPELLRCRHGIFWDLFPVGSGCGRGCVPTEDGIKAARATRSRWWLKRHGLLTKKGAK